MTIIAKFSIIEYGKNSELSQLTEGDCLRSDAKKLSPIKNLNCIMNEVNKLTTHFQNVDKDAFFRKYKRLVEIARVEVFKPSCASHSSFLGSRLLVFFFWKHRPMSHYGGIWDVD
jgi:ribosomal protein S15P/S13E